MECKVTKLNIEAELILQNSDGYMIVYNNEIMFQSENHKIAVDAPGIREIDNVECNGIAYHAIILAEDCIIDSIRTISDDYNEQEIIEAYKNNNFKEVEELLTYNVIEMIHIRKKYLC